MAIRVMIYDDNKGRQEALRLLLSNTTDMEFVGGKENCNEVEADMIAFKPDVVLMDIDMPGVNGIEGLKIIRKTAPDIFIIMQTVFEEEEKILTAISSGAHGYFLKQTSPVKLIEGIREVLNGGAPMTSSVARKVLEIFKVQSAATNKDQFDLSEREISILTMLTKGMSYKMIADSAGITFHTVNTHLKKIYEKLQVHSATEAVAKAFHHRLIQNNQPDKKNKKGS